MIGSLRQVYIISCVNYQNWLHHYVLIEWGLYSIRGEKGQNRLAVIVVRDGWWAGRTGRPSGRTVGLGGRTVGLAGCTAGPARRTSGAARGTGGPARRTVGLLTGVEASKS